MRKVLILGIEELKILAKDRQALALLFIMPLALIVFLTFALQDVYRNKVGVAHTLTIVTKDDCEAKSVCGLLIKKLQTFNYQIQLLSSLDIHSKMDLALVLPNSVGQTVDLIQQKQSLKNSDQIQLLFNPLLDQSYRALVEGQLMLAMQSIMIEQMGAKLQAAAKNQGQGPQLTDISQFEGLVVEKAFGDIVLPNPIQQSVPAWTLFGMFFIVIPLTNSMIRDRRLGIFKRLLSFPVSKLQLVTGKVFPFLFINIIQFVLMFSVGFFILPRWTNLNLDLDISWTALALVTVTCAMAATSYALLVSCFAKTSEQAHAFGAFSVLILAILGGVMIPRFVMPEFMQSLSIVSPLYWGLDAYLDLIVRHLSLANVLPKIMLLSAFSLAAVFIASLRFRWSDEE